MKYAYPTYQIELPEGLMRRCVDLAPRLLHEAGMRVANARFLEKIKDKPGLRLSGDRVYFDAEPTREAIDRFVERARADWQRQKAELAGPPGDWRVATAGYSMMTLDLETEALREATRDDLRRYIRLARAFGVGGSYMVMPQDVPAILQPIACCKICYQEADDFRPYDYQRAEQFPFVYEMHRIVGQPMHLDVNISQAMAVDGGDLDTLLDYHDAMKRDGDIFIAPHNYTLGGVTKPVSAAGCAAMTFTELLGLHILLNAFDPEIESRVKLAGSHPTDLRHACWAFGHPRLHLFQYLNGQMLPNLLGETAEAHAWTSTRLETSSPAVDAHAALEKMAVALTAALQGCRSFDYAGTLCVDDVWSPTQFVIDLEIVDYVRDLVEAFDPHPDVIAVEGLYEECLAVARGGDTFLSHENTLSRFHNILSASKLLVREKLRSWMAHRRLLKDRARDLAIEKLKNAEPFRLPEDKHEALEKVYEKAREQLL